eukprot:UN06047
MGYFSSSIPHRKVSIQRTCQNFQKFPFQFPVRKNADLACKHLNLCVSQHFRL